nr:hypothetical protein [Prevotella sp.]
MKNIFLAIPLLALALASCDPSYVDDGSEWSNVSKDQLQLSATAVQVDNKNSNLIHVVCKSPTNVAWQADQLIEKTTNTVSADDTIYFTKLGSQTVKCLTSNTGTMDTTELSVQVDTISYITSAISDRLCIGKTGAPSYFGTSFNKNLITVKQRTSLAGKLGNSLEITSNVNPVLCTFKWGGVTMDKNIGVLTQYALNTPSELTVTIENAAGKSETYSLGTYTAADYSDAPSEIKLLTNCDPTDVSTYSNSKTWVLSSGNNWGNGNSTDAQSGWWSTDVTGQGGSYGSMTLSFMDGKLTKTIDDPTNARGDKSSVGSFALDFGAANASKNIVCTLTTSGEGNIVFPYLINENYYETHKFEITKITSKELYLRAQHITNPSTGEGTFWHFVAK